MSDDAICALLMIVTFFMGAWNGWAWRYLVAKRRLRQMREEREHRDHHVFPHPNGGTFPYMQPVCTCDQFDGES